MGGLVGRWVAKLVARQLSISQKHKMGDKSKEVANRQQTVAHKKLKRLSGFRTTLESFRFPDSDQNYLYRSGSFH